MPQKSATQSAVVNSPVSPFLSSASAELQQEGELVEDPRKSILQSYSAFPKGDQEPIQKAVEFVFTRTAPSTTITGGQ